MTKPLQIVAGPTGSGKTKFAIELAKKLNGELVVADSRQIYKYLPIGTNNGNLKFEHTISLDSPLLDIPVHSDSGILLHMVQFLNPNEEFDIVSYKNIAQELIKKIKAKGKIPIIVGGTGFYIDSLILQNYDYGNVSKNPEVRESLTSKTKIELQTIAMQNIDDWNAMNNSDRQNPSRLVRLIEKRLSGMQNNSKVEREFIEYQMFYPKFEWIDLKQKITNRVLLMFERGLVTEVQNVLEMGFPKDSKALQGIGFREVLQFLEGKLTLQEAKDLVIFGHIKYAKRQRTWFENKSRGYKLEYVKY